VFHVQAATGFDDIIWDKEQTITFVGMMVPLALAILALLLGCFLVTAAFWRVADSRLERGLVAPSSDQRNLTTLWSQWVARNHHWYTPVPTHDEGYVGASTPRDVQSYNLVSSSGRYQTS
jgi:hypothetical protein